jgi:hypothetical protein
VPTGVDAALPVRVRFGDGERALADVAAEVLLEPRDDVIERGARVVDQVRSMQGDGGGRWSLDDEPGDDDGEARVVECDPERALVAAVGPDVLAGEVREVRKMFFGPAQLDEFGRGLRCTQTGSTFDGPGRPRRIPDDCRCII